MTDQKLTFVVASENPGKILEIAAIFSTFFSAANTNLPNRQACVRQTCVILRPSELDVTVEYPPEGSDYTSNAIAKALAAAKQTGFPAIADDSGLEVDALGGRPGVHSARYDTTDERRIAKLLEELKSFGDPKMRRAQFRAVAALGYPDRRTLSAEGIWKGVIAFEPRGGGGFGYDPIFVDLELGKTAAEMTAEEKSARSHRGQALRHLATLITQKW